MRVERWPRASRASEKTQQLQEVALYNTHYNAKTARSSERYLKFQGWWPYWSSTRQSWESMLKRALKGGGGNLLYRFQRGAEFLLGIGLHTFIISVK